MESAMRFCIRLATGILALNLPVAAQAQDIEIYGGVTLTSNYVFRSVTFSDDRPAVQPYIEAEVNGFYAGVWGSNVDFGPGGTDNYEVDYYLGYRGETTGGFTYDINYARFTFDDTGNCCGEVNLVLGLPVGDATTVSAVFAYDPDAETLASGAGVSYNLNDAWTVSGTFGRDEALSHNYWDAGVSYALNDTTSFDLRYHDTSSTDALLVAGVSFDFTLLSR
jgi:uncharacterized protein (TIGR02001 family)